jgi:hypothetical protein
MYWTGAIFAGLLDFVDFVARLVVERVVLAAFVVFAFVDRVLDVTFFTAIEFSPGLSSL